jgi:lipoyl(octanoyl) transferase
MGVHVRRHVTALGVAVNVNVSVAGPVSVNPWARFVPCGLEDRAVTNVAHEMGLSADGRDGVYRDVDNVLDMEALAAAWASEFARRLGLVGVNQVRVDALEMVNRAA